jgi:hypothetical protein
MSPPVRQDFHQRIAHGGSGQYRRQDMRLPVLSPHVWQQGQPWAGRQHNSYPSTGGLQTAGVPAHE